MSDEKVLLDIEIADAIFARLSSLNHVLKESGVAAHDRRELMREMVKLKVAINNARNIRSENMDLADGILDMLGKINV